MNCVTYLCCVTRYQAGWDNGSWRPADASGAQQPDGPLGLISEALRPVLTRMASSINSRPVLTRMVSSIGTFANSAAERLSMRVSTADDGKRYFELKGSERASDVDMDSCGR